MTPTDDRALDALVHELLYGDPADVEDQCELDRKAVSAIAALRAQVQVWKARAMPIEGCLQVTVDAFVAEVARRTDMTGIPVYYAVWPNQAPVPLVREQASAWVKAEQGAVHNDDQHKAAELDNSQPD